MGTDHKRQNERLRRFSRGTYAPFRRENADRRPGTRARSIHGASIWEFLG